MRIFRLLLVWVIALPVIVAPTSADAQISFRFPAKDPTGQFFWPIATVHMDHKAGTGLGGWDCYNYNGTAFPACYDEHEGTDFLLLGAFSANKAAYDLMNNNDVEIVAAADGVVVATADGNYDQCEATVGSQQVDCHGNPIIPNLVKLEHAGGITTLYVHMKKNSVKVKVGDAVTCGQVLGYVGSSGISATPHLHFEVRDLNDALIDPFAGQHTQPNSYWVQQVGVLGLPGEYCAGETILPDAGIPIDAGVAPDATPSVDAAPPMVDAPGATPDVPPTPPIDAGPADAATAQDTAQITDDDLPQQRDATLDPETSPPADSALHDAPQGTDGTAPYTPPPESGGCALAGSSTIPSTLLLCMGLCFLALRRRKH